MDADGFLWYVSRVDDLIKSRGYLISPKEVEDVLQEHPAVMEAAVIGIKDPELRERVKAFIVLREGVLPSEDLAKDIREFVSSRIAPFKAPKEVEFVDSLPKTVTGKVMRRTLRGLEESGKSVGIRYRF
jgi:acyl-coenzyme A synthetase/AMP-(fatty) acid ligase